MSGITAPAFIAKWRHVQLTERSASQQHFLVPRDEQTAGELAKRTLTNLYNQRPAWLDHAHRRLDEAVSDAYGWDPSLSDEDILERLLRLNLERPHV